MTAPAELLRALAVMAEPPGPEHARLAELVGLDAAPDAAAFTQVVVLDLPPYASIHLGPEGMLGGAARARISGFWTALGYAPPADPDHLATLVGLYAALLEGEREAGGAQAVLLGSSREALLHEHLATWAFGWLDRVAELGVEPFAAWARMLARVLAAEVERSAPPAALPLHLREAPELPDPRVDGAGAFVAGILSPVRSGMVVTRGALTRAARGLGLGVRLGERRYVLEHLLGLDPGGVLHALAREAARQREGHVGRLPLLGETAAFWQARADRTACLLDELAEEEAHAPGAEAVVR